MRRRPPSSPLFPYTTLFRSGAAHVVGPCAPDLEAVVLELRVVAQQRHEQQRTADRPARGAVGLVVLAVRVQARAIVDRKSTRLNSSHMSISYAVFCLKKKKT